MFQITDSHHIVVIGGGATGTELAVEIAAEYPEKEVTLIHSGKELVNDQFTENFQNKLKGILDRYFVKYKLGIYSLPQEMFCCRRILYRFYCVIQTLRRHFN